MKKLSRLDVIRRLVFSMLLILPATLGAQTRPPIVERVAKTYGLDSWDKIEAIRYTHNLQLGTLNVSRSWEWEPKTTQVTYEGKDKDGKPVKVTYKRSELSSQPDMVKNDIDPAFINDNYTLLFLLKAYWDSSPAVIDAGTYNLPVGSGSAELVAVSILRKAEVTRPATPLNSTSAKTTASSTLCTTAAGPRSPALSS